MRARLLLGSTVVLLVAATAATGSWYPVGFVLALIASIAAHEAGHWIAARRNGMAVTHASLGMGTAIWTRKAGDVELGLRVLPVGGSVRIAGMNNTDDPPEGVPEEATYRAASFAARVAVAFAGPATNLVIAFVLFAVMFAAYGDNSKTAVTALVDHVQLGSPAEAIGMRAGDTIIEINETPITSGNKLLTALLASPPGQPATITYQHEGSPVPVQRTTQLETSDGTPRLGIHLAIEPERFSPIAAVAHGAETMWEDTTASLAGLASFVSDGAATYAKQLRGSGPVQVNEDEPRLVSPIGMVQVANKTSDIGVWALMWLIADINLGLALFNLLPIPPLDGGLMAITGYERLRTRRGQPRYAIRYEKIVPVIVGVVVILAGLTLVSAFLDVFRPIQY